MSTLAVLLVLAVLVGVAATLLVAAAPPAAAPRAGEVQVNLPTEVWGLLMVGPLLAGLGAICYRWSRSPSGNVGRTMLLGLSILAFVGVAFLVVVAAVHPSAGGVGVTTGRGGSAGGGGSGNSTTSPPPTTNNTTHGSPSPVGGGSVPGTYVYTIGPWTLLAVGLLLCGGVVLIAVPGVLPRLLDRPPRAAKVASVDRKQVTVAFTEASAAIARGDDFRETIVRLYLALLAGLTTRAGDVACLTPEEIRLQVLQRLGVTAAPARELTRLFEEARYSTHPMSIAQADRFRGAVASIQGDLLRGAPR